MGPAEAAETALAMAVAERMAGTAVAWVRACAEEAMRWARPVKDVVALEEASMASVT